MDTLTLNEALPLASMTVDDGCLVLQVPSLEPITSYNTAYFPWLQQFSGLNEVTVRDDATGICYEFKGLTDACFEYGLCSSTYTWRFTECCPPFTGSLSGGCPKPCFASGTAIRTPDGERAVEALAAGDTVSLANGGAARIRWVGHRRSRNAPAVRFGAGSLGAGVPARDLVVSPDHAMALGDCLVPAERLVDGAGIRRERLDDVMFFHVELDRHDVLLAEGAAAESYLDTGNRAQFSNCPIGAVAACPDPAASPCRELVTDGARLDALRAALPGAQARTPLAA